MRMAMGLGLPPGARGLIGANALLSGYAQGFAFLANANSGRGQVAVKDTGTPANNLSNADAPDLITNAGTSPKLVKQQDGTYAWSPHNLFVSPTSPATQNVTLITGATYTYTVTGVGSLAGSSGASGTATEGSPVTFTATGTTGTFTLTGSLDTIQINRGSSATSFVNGGASAGFEPAFEWDADFGSSGGWRLLSERQATNLLVQSSEFDDAAWSALNVTVGANAVTDPLGTTTADTITDDGTNSHHMVTDAITLGSATNAAFTVFAKPGTNSYLMINVATSAENHITAVFDLSDTAATARSDEDFGTTSGTISSTSQEYDANTGWFRCTLVGQVGAANPTVALGHAEAATGNTFNTTGRVTYAGTGKTLHFWGAQAETGTVATSPIPTYGATATRAADVLSVAAASIPTSVTFSTVAQFEKREVTSKSYVLMADPTGNDLFAIFFNSNDDVRHYLRDDANNTTNYIAGGGTALVAGTTYRIATASAANDHAASVGGTTVATNATAGAISSFDVALNIGAEAPGGGQLNGYIDEIIYIPQRLANATLQALSA